MSWYLFHKSHLNKILKVGFIHRLKVTSIERKIHREYTTTSKIHIQEYKSTTTKIWQTLVFARLSPMSDVRSYRWSTRQDLSFFGPPWPVAYPPPPLGRQDVQPPVYRGPVQGP